MGDYCTNRPLLSAYQDAADMIVKKATGHKPPKLDLIYSKENFIEQFADILHDATELSDADFDVLLVYLSRDSGAISYDGKVSKCYIQCFSENYLLISTDHQIQVCGRLSRYHSTRFNNCLHQDSCINNDKTGGGP